MAQSPLNLFTRNTRLFKLSRVRMPECVKVKCRVSKFRMNHMRAALHDARLNIRTILPHCNHLYFLTITLRIDISVQVPIQTNIRICDEAHNLIEYCRYTPGPTPSSRASDALCRAAKDSKTLVVAMTATPDALEHMKCQQYTVPIDTSELRQYKNHNIVHYASLKGLIQDIPLQQIGAIFTIHVKQMIELADLAASCGRKPLCIWSPNSQDHPLSLEQQKRGPIS